MQKTVSASPEIAAARLKKISSLRPKLALVLGSGFHHVLMELHADKKVSYAKISGFPQPTVSGHAGELYFGRLGKTPVLVLSGRTHFYEGLSMERVTFAVRALAAFGIRDLLLTNAAGGINRNFRAGDFMVVADHINFMGANPLRPDVVARASSPFDGNQKHAGETPAPLNRFVDMTGAYDKGLNSLLFQAGKKCNLRLRRGVYLAVSGPGYETPAEIRAFARLGADAVGMSTVPEAVVARQCGLNVAAVSCITNLATALGQAPLSHADVLETAAKVKPLAANLLKNFAGLYLKGRMRNEE